MKVLIVGGGGREHAIGLKLARSPRRPRLFFAPGNPGMEALGACHPVKSTDLHGLVDLARREGADLTVVGPEQPLVEGLVDRFQSQGLRVFGPTRAAAALEGSKAFSKAFMERHGIPTARHRTFDRLENAEAYIRAQGAPIVVKASGLAGGKGAVVCTTLEEALAAARSMLGPEAVFGAAGSEVVVEECMEGEEASVFALCDGDNYVLLPSAQDHKRVRDGDQGPNTGGMGAYAPAPVLSEADLALVRSRILEPTLMGMRREGRPYAGFLYMGLMLTPEGPKVVEYNCRLGDPEAQVVLPILRDDLLELVEAACRAGLAGRSAAFTGESAAVVVLAAEGYPGKYATGVPIEGLEDAGSVPGAHIVHAGTRRAGGRIVTAGGRALGLVGQGASLPEALKAAYAAAERVRFEGMHYRRDIGAKGLARLQIP